MAVSASTYENADISHRFFCWLLPLLGCSATQDKDKMRAVVFCLLCASLIATVVPRRVARSRKVVRFDVGIDCLYASVTPEQFMGCFRPTNPNAPLTQATIKNRLTEILDPVFMATVLEPMSSNREQNLFFNATKEENTRRKKT
uniref:UmuC domain-containing protein n=1 Tax=Steinernema glaseri TaxID=37863 RepID=A0A1I7Y5C7_9BILA